MAVDLPLPAMLSRLLIAFTIEFDNEFEHRMPHRTAMDRTPRGPWLVSMAMWANFMRLLPQQGAPLRDLRRLVPLINLGGLERWGYVTVAPEGADTAPPRSDWIVRPTRAGLAAQSIWRPLAGEIEERWRERFGASTVEGLTAALRTIVTRLDLDLPHYLPVVLYSNGMMTADPAGAAPADATDCDLVTLLAQALLAFTLEFERDSAVSLAISANILRILDDDGVRVRDLPRRSGVSKEASRGSLAFLERRGYVVVELINKTKVVRPTAAGRTATGAYRRRVARVEQQWQERFGGDVDALRQAMSAVLEGPLSAGLTPYPDGWRARAPYAAQTDAVRRDPLLALPHHPMVLHRGGYPDGS